MHKRFTTLLLLAVSSVSLAGAAPAATIIYSANLSGANEVPQNGSTASGNIMVTVDDVANTLSVEESFANLSSLATGAHIHCCTSPGNVTGVAIPFLAFPSATTGTFAATYDLMQAATYTSAFFAAAGGTALGARNALLTGLASGQAYANIHNSIYPGGEIRGQLAAVPEPSSWALMLIGFGAVGGSVRMRRKPIAFA